MCVGEATFLHSGKGLAWHCIGIHLYLHFPHSPSAEGEMVGRDILHKSEHADVMTLLAWRYDRIIGSFFCVPE